MEFLLQLKGVPGSRSFKKNLTKILLSKRENTFKHMLMKLCHKSLFIDNLLNLKFVSPFLGKSPELNH